MLTAREISDKINSYSPDADTEIVQRAYAFARKAHHDQKRYSGEPYFSHPVATALNLVRMQLDPVTVAAGLLHDVPEDTAVSLEQIRQEFGDEVAFLVDAVTKVSKVRFDPAIIQENSAAKTEVQLAREQAAVENLRKMLLAMAQDIRVVLIKLADRLHNMETLVAVPTEKQYRIAKETLEIYAPLAERLGMGEMKGRLEDLAFPYVDPEGYAWVAEHARPLYAETDRYLRRVMRFVEGELQGQGIHTASVHGRAKHLYSLYRKLQVKGRNLQEVYDLVAVRIIVDDVHSCYEVLGMLHLHWKPLLGRIKDYIALPKPNGYQSLHTTVFCLDGRVVEFQIRTEAMHRAAEYGIAAHWSYAGYKTGDSFSGKRLTWVQQLAQWQQELSSSQEFLEALKIDTFKHRIFVFTPKGEVKDLPAGATPLDFAYQIHSKVGDHTYGAKINGKLSHLSTQLQNGDVVEIMTNPKSQPRPDWLELAITSSAKGHIRRALREQHIIEEVEKTPEPVVERIAVFPVTPAKVKARQEAEVLVEGRRGYQIRMAQCCQPQVGDGIIGLVSKDGISVHQRWCDNVREIGDPGKLVRVSWVGQAERQRAQLRMEAYDKRGLARDLAAIVTEAGWNIIGVRGDSLDDGVVSYSLLIELDDGLDLPALMDKLRQHPNIFLLERT